MIEVEVSLGLALNYIWVKPEPGGVEKVCEVDLSDDSISSIVGLIKVKFELVLRVLARNNVGSNL